MSFEMNAVSWIMVTEAVCIVVLFMSIMALITHGGCRDWLDDLCCWAITLTAVLMLLLGLVSAYWFGI